jgi:uncharacterized protein YjbJ (UPF0337 family)
VNEDIIKGQWKQIRGKAKEWWSKLTDDDLNMINGKRDQLLGKLQEKYGYTREEATRQLDQRLTELQPTVPMARR